MPGKPPPALAQAFPRRGRGGRKGDRGRVLVVGGSQKYTGCVALNALAALRAGADLVTVLAPRRAADVAAGFAPDLITVPFRAPALTADAWPHFSREIATANALVIGCGLERTRASHEGIRRALREAGGTPVVVDAEAIHALQHHPDLLRGRAGVVTPHAGEFEVLTGERLAGKRSSERAAVVKRWARDLRVVIVLKGATDIVSDGSHVYLDREGSPFMTKGGWGDTLAGVTGALLARGVDPFAAASCAAWIVGRAGALAAREFHEGLLASDALVRIPQAIAQGVVEARRSAR